MTRQQNITYQTNPALSIVKKGWRGNIVINGTFFNDTKPVKSPLGDVLKWKLTANPQKEAKKQDSFQLKVTPLSKIDKTKDSIIWLGHASFLITTNGKTLLTDPCFYNIPSVKRLVDLPCDIKLLTNIDYLLLSHDHRDHFDVKSVKEIIILNPSIEILTSLNFKKLLAKNGITTVKIQEAGWYQQYKTTDISIIFLPAKHWGRRTLFDFNKVLWGSFLIKSNSKSVFFSGDTAYSDTIFKEINTEFGAFDICLLPIGAYAPSYIMSQSHTTPEEAFQIFKELNGTTFIPMHYGTFDLSDEPLGEPLQRIKKSFEKQSNNLKILNVGSVHTT